MNHTDFKTHCLNPKEKIIGTVWLVFQTSFFAMLLQWLNTLLPAPLPQTEINLIFFSVNFTAIAIIFRQYLWAQIKLIPEIFEKIFSITVSGFAVYWALKTLLTQVLFALEPDFTNVNDVAIQNLIAENYAIMFVGTVILAPITEEMLFRGLVFRGLYDHTPGLAWVFSVALFALIHILGYIIASLLFAVPTCGHLSGGGISSVRFPALPNSHPCFGQSCGHAVFEVKSCLKSFNFPNMLPT